MTQPTVLRMLRDHDEKGAAAVAGCSVQADGFGDVGDGQAGLLVDRGDVGGCVGMKMQMARAVAACVLAIVRVTG